MPVLLLAACAVIGATGLPALAQKAGTTWRGQVLQPYPDGKTGVYPVRMTLSDAGGTIDYPSLSCGGTLTRLRTVGDVVEYREKLTYGANRCIDNGTVGVRIKGRLLLWHWTGEAGGYPDEGASAVLKEAPLTN